MTATEAATDEKPSAGVGPEVDVVVALAGALGTDLEAVGHALQVAFRGCGVHTESISLSELIRTVPGHEGLRQQPYDERIDAHMNAGNEVRRDFQRGDALALLAAERIAQLRRAEHPRACYVLRSVKHPAEVRTLRSVYGERFFLVSAYMNRPLRIERLRGLIERSNPNKEPADWSWHPEGLVERDENESSEYGQKVRDTFPLADFFVNAGSEAMPAEVNRFVELILGHPFRTPSREEYGFACAEIAALRSAELGRQVGASLVSREGEVVALGVNEVPRLGGLYWEGDEPDGREFQFSLDPGEERNLDTNDSFKQLIANEIAQTLAERSYLREGVTASESEELLEALMRTGLGTVTEFGRAVHAEMAALLDAYRRRAATVGSTLYSTTFPCHNCARHLVAAGVREVVYVAPYAKSQAHRLHRDSIAVADVDGDQSDKMVLRPFVGIAPRLYTRVFKASHRKLKDGAVRVFDRTTAELILPDGPNEFAINRPLDAERNAIAELNKIQTELVATSAQVGDAGNDSDLAVDA